MRKWLFAALLLAGCATVSEDELPQAYIVVGEQTYETQIGTYCWDEVCVDKVRPDEQLQDAKPIVVQAGEWLDVQLQATERPTDVDMSLVHGNDVQSVPLQNGRIAAPTEHGVYFYSYTASWIEGDISYGDVSYVFSIEVQ